MVLAISENHVSTATAQQSVYIFSSGVAATATADSGSGSVLIYTVNLLLINCSEPPDLAVWHCQLRLELGLIN